MTFASSGSGPALIFPGPQRPAIASQCQRRDSAPVASVPSPKSARTQPPLRSDHALAAELLLFPFHPDLHPDFLSASLTLPFLLRQSGF
ncbi:hypothetical protein VTN00DRAFT_6163 [Thermoascus crustaceus]|uniref:uncharacterized protein n=1 Tax=Thermoascus crustaceus TaxID=5088 RepID=UPI0037437488